MTLVMWQRGGGWRNEGGDGSQKGRSHCDVSGAIWQGLVLSRDACFNSSTGSHEPIPSAWVSCAGGSVRTGRGLGRHFFVLVDVVFCVENDLERRP